MTNRSRIAPTTVVAVLAAVAALLLSGCSASAKQAHWSGSNGQTAGSPSTTATLGPGVLAVVPAANSANVSPGEPVMVTATGAATVTSVTLKAGSKTIDGKLAADGHSWTSTGKLSWGTKYTLKVAASNVASGAPKTSTFTTINPDKTVKPYLQANAYGLLKDGGTYGVGEPLIVHFNHSIPTSARAAVVKSLQVTSSPVVEGRWHWIDSTDVHYRPEVYWAAHSTITINANLYGVKLGSGTYGASNTSATIHIGDSHVAKANNKTHHMLVYVNGVMTRDVPVSMGRGGIVDGGGGTKVNLWTRSGPHVVIQKTPFTMMSSGSFGLVDTSSPLYYPPLKVYDTVRISYTGEFVHLRTWSVSQIGHGNGSHGCINVGVANAKWMYDLLIPGDVVEVTGTPIELPVTDGLGDWTIPWSKW